MGVKFPSTYRFYLMSSGGTLTPQGAHTYAPELLKERNETWETAEYAPGYIAIGDDSGGTVYLIKQDDPLCRVYMADSGSMTSDTMDTVAGSWRDWELSGFARRPQ